MGFGLGYWGLGGLGFFFLSKLLFKVLEQRGQRQEGRAGQTEQGKAERAVPGCPFGRKDPPSRLVCAFTELRAVDSRHPAEAEAGRLWTRPPSMVAARETRALLRGSERLRPCVRTVQPKEERTRCLQPKMLYQFVTPESTHMFVYHWNVAMPTFAMATSSCCSLDYSSKRRECFTRAPSAIRATSRELISSDDIAEVIGCRALRPVSATGLGHELHH